MITYIIVMLTSVVVVLAWPVLLWAVVLERLAVLWG
jgi:hypothetical protein